MTKVSVKFWSLFYKMDANLLDNKLSLIQSSYLNSSQNDAIAIKCGQTRCWVSLFQLILLNFLKIIIFKLEKLY